MIANSPQTRIAPFVRGEVIRADRLNQLVSAITRLEAGVRAPQQVFPQPIGQADIILGFQIQSAGDVHYNYIVATGTDGQVHNVARPALNQRNSAEGQNPRDGYTITYAGPQSRTVTGSFPESPEQQTIGPTNYEAGDWFLGVKAASSVWDDPGDDTVDCDYMSIDARVWGPLPSV